MKKAIILGANGQLGSDLVIALQNSYEVLALTHQDVDVGNLTDLLKIIHCLSPDILINATAYHQVDLCEQNPDSSYLINSLAVGFMARVCKNRNIKFIHFSTDYVFDGLKNSPYIESDQAIPLNIYGQTKLVGEQQVLSANPDAIIFRISAIYGLQPCRAKNGLNFIQLMLKLAHERGKVKVVADEFVSPTFTKNIAAQVAQVLDSKLIGIIHATSEGACSWYEFAEEIFSYTNTKVLLSKAQAADFPSKVSRPKYSVLHNHKLEENHLNGMLPWKTSLHQYLDELSLKKN